MNRLFTVSSTFGHSSPTKEHDDKGLMKGLKVRLMERMLGAELTEHLGYEPHDEPTNQQTTGPKTHHPDGPKAD